MKAFKWWLVLLHLTFVFGVELHLKCLVDVCKDSKCLLMMNWKLLALTYHTFCVCVCVFTGQNIEISLTVTCSGIGKSGCRVEVFHFCTSECVRWRHSFPTELLCLLTCLLILRAIFILSIHPSPPRCSFRNHSCQNPVCDCGQTWL